MDRRSKAALIAVAATWLVVWGWSGGENALMTFAIVGYGGVTIGGVVAIVYAVVGDER